MNNRKYPPGPEIETIERLMKKRDDLQEENKHLRDLLRRAKPWLESYLEYLDTDIPLLGEPNSSVANLVDELAEELK